MSTPLEGEAKDENWLKRGEGFSRLRFQRTVGEMHFTTGTTEHLAGLRQRFPHWFGLTMDEVGNTGGHLDGSNC